MIASQHAKFKLLTGREMNGMGSPPKSSVVHLRRGEQQYGYTYQYTPLIDTCTVLAEGVRPAP
eukprot:COSAG02_NODE_1705_length_11236_cov_6.168178_8_plen_63_part_00